MDNIATFKNEFGLIIIGAIIFTASFLWKDLLSDVEEIYFPKINGLTGRFVFTVIITIALICFAVLLRRILRLDSASRTRSNIQFDDSPVDDSGNGGGDSGGDSGGD